MRAPFLNVDAGESDAEPEELYRVAHLLSIACGGHAGDEASMRRVVALCKEYGTAIGAHPSYPDRAGFGRTSLKIDPSALSAIVSAQMTALARVAASVGVTVVGMKPHGALYHDANADGAVARAVIRGTVDALGEGITVLGPAVGHLRDAAGELGLTYAREVFADRGVRSDGSLVPRGEAGAVLQDPEEARARASFLLQAGGFETMCVHGDTPNALAIARAVRLVLEASL